MYIILLWLVQFNVPRWGRPTEPERFVCFVNKLFEWKFRNIVSINTLYGKTHFCYIDWLTVPVLKLCLYRHGSVHYSSIRACQILVMATERHATIFATECRHWMIQGVIQAFALEGSYIEMKGFSIDSWVIMWAKHNIKASCLRTYEFMQSTRVVQLISITVALEFTFSAQAQTLEFRQ